MDIESEVREPIETMEDHLRKFILSKPTNYPVTFLQEGFDIIQGEFISGRHQSTDLMLNFIGCGLIYMQG